MPEYVVWFPSLYHETNYALQVIYIHQNVPGVLRKGIISVKSWEVQCLTQL